jgi:hypothetical protein
MKRFLLIIAWVMFGASGFARAMEMEYGDLSPLPLEEEAGALFAQHEVLLPHCSDIQDNGTWFRTGDTSELEELSNEHLALLMDTYNSSQEKKRLSKKTSKKAQGKEKESLRTITKSVRKQAKDNDIIDALIQCCVSRCITETKGMVLMRKHLRDMHTLYTYWCLHCDKKFLEPKDLKAHYQQLPRLGKNFICGTCCTFSSTIKQHKAHVEYHQKIAKNQRESFSHKNKQVSLVHPCKDKESCGASFMRESHCFEHEFFVHRLKHCTLLNSARIKEEAKDEK